MALPELTSEEIGRYSRHLILPEVGMDGQRRLKQSRVLLVGTGGLGAPLGMYLAAAGVGTLGLVDFDVVDGSNLQRQIIHGTKDVGRPKIASARDRLLDINPNVRIETFETRLTSANALVDPARLRRRRRRDGQLSHALPGQRRLRAAGQAQRLRLDLPLRGPGQRVRHARRAVLPLPLSRAAAAGTRAVVRRGRRAGRAARASSARSRRPRRSSCCWAAGRRWSAGCSCSTRGR